MIWGGGDIIRTEIKCKSQKHTPSTKLVSDAERLGTTVLVDSVTQTVSSSNTEFTLHVGRAFPGTIICCLHHHTFFVFFFLQISFFFSLYLLFSEIPSKDLTWESTWDAWAHKGPRGDVEGNTCVPWHGVKMVCLWLFLGRASVNLSISFSKD